MTNVTLGVHELHTLIADRANLMMRCFQLPCNQRAVDETTIVILKMLGVSDKHLAGEVWSSGIKPEEAKKIWWEWKDDTQ